MLTTQFHFAAAKFRTYYWIWQIKDQFPIAKCEQRCCCIMSREAEVILENTPQKPRQEIRAMMGLL